MTTDIVGSDHPAIRISNKGYLVAFDGSVFTFCGKIIAYNQQKNIYKCKSCDNSTNFAKINIPYSCKLLFQELLTMNIAPRLITE